MISMNDQTQLSVYYDGLCILCSKEMDFYRKKDPDRRISYVDISAENFDPNAEGLENRDINKYFHAKNKNGDILVGVPAFQEIWKTLGIFKGLSYLAKASLTAPLFQMGYLIFIHARPYLPRKKCDTDRCHV